MAQVSNWPFKKLSKPSNWENWLWYNHPVQLNPPISKWMQITTEFQTNGKWQIQNTSKAKTATKYLGHKWSEKGHKLNSMRLEISTWAKFSHWKGIGALSVKELSEHLNKFHIWAFQKNSFLLSFHQKTSHNWTFKTDALTGGNFYLQKWKWCQKFWLKTQSIVWKLTIGMLLGNNPRIWILCDILNLKQQCEMAIGHLTRHHTEKLFSTRHHIKKLFSTRHHIKRDFSEFNPNPGLP